MEALEPKAQYHDDVLDSKKSFTITEIVNDLNMTAQQLNKLLKDLRIQRKIGGTWVLYAEHQDKVIAKLVEEEKEVRNKYIEILCKKDIYLGEFEKIPLLVN
ncbi:phage antirepressor KilAC domain-containing protein [Bacillus pretiosus]|uniref:phage antirepressor KilAC domain-containing protein n=1 Tax=Bacillus pretiosus TaxID=2983392 RepID=UPI003D652728